MRANMLILVFTVVLSALAASVLFQSPRILEQPIAISVSARPLNVEPKLEPAIQAWNINRVSIGMTRRQLEILFDGNLNPDERGKKFYEFFGIEDGAMVSPNATDVHFDKSDVVTGVRGRNLSLNRKPIFTLPWATTQPSERKREQILQVLGRPLHKSRLGREVIWIYAEPELEVIFDDTACVFILGEQPDTKKSSSLSRKLQN